MSETKGSCLPQALLCMPAAVRLRTGTKVCVELHLSSAVAVGFLVFLLAAALGSLLGWLFRWLCFVSGVLALSWASLAFFFFFPSGCGSVSFVVVSFAVLSCVLCWALFETSVFSIVWTKVVVLAL